LQAAPGAERRRLLHGRRAPPEAGRGALIPLPRAVQPPQQVSRSALRFTKRVFTKRVATAGQATGGCAPSAIRDCGLPGLPPPPHAACALEG
jgi:hypothetical protein